MSFSYSASETPIYIGDNLGAIDESRISGGGGGGRHFSQGCHFGFMLYILLYSDEFKISLFAFFRDNFL